MRGEMSALVAAYKCVRNRMCDLLLEEAEPAYETIHELDVELKSSFDQILTATPGSFEETLERVQFLIELVNEASEGNSLVIAMTESISKDVRSIVEGAKT